MIVLRSFSKKFYRRLVIGVSLPVLMLLLASGCGKAHTEEAPASSEAKRKKMGELTEEMHTLKAERDKLDDEFKEKQHKYEAIRTSSLTALIGYVKKDDLIRNVPQPGFVASYETTPIYTYIPGVVEKIAMHKGPAGMRQVDIGDSVKKGEVLAVLFVPERVADVKRKKAMVLQARAELIQANEMLETAKANVKTTEAQIKEEISVRPRIKAKYERWSSELDRITKLHKDGVVDKQILDETKHQFMGVEGELGEVEAKVRRAEAANEESKAKKARAVADVAVAKSHIDVAEADQEEAQNWLDYREIRAPFDGKITDRSVHTGHMVKPVQAGEKGDPLFVIVREDIMRIVVDVPENDAEYIQVGGRAHILIQAQENQATGSKGDFEATVTRKSDRLNETTRTLRVEFDVENSKYHLMPGNYAYADIPIDYKGVWTLPESALVQKEEQGSFVFREVDGNAVFTPVKTGVRANKKVQLLKYQEKPASPGAEGKWCDFTGRERIILNPAGFVDGVKIEQSEPAN